MSLVIKGRTVAALGLRNVLRVLVYRTGVKLGFGRVRRIKAPVPQGPFFFRCQARKDIPSPSQSWRNEAVYFDTRSVPIHGHAPNWMFNPYTGRSFQNSALPWWKIPDFDPSFGDIKIIWEPSRFGWVLAAAQRAAAGQEEGWSQLENWLTDWCEHNPPYQGPNWKCGQEASIRVLHLAMATVITSNAATPLQGMQDLIEAHLRRIRPTVQYAIGQDNNHGTSEAAALFVGGSMLLRAGRSVGQRYVRLGRSLIEDRVTHLVEQDGSFSQQSLNYHRFFLDTMSMVEVWRRRVGLPAFSESVQSRLERASRWLLEMVDPTVGDGPNLGANDGARLLPLADTSYRDFRPSVQLAVALFCGERAYSQPGPWNDALAWLGCSLPEQETVHNGTQHFSDGGYIVLANERARVLFRYPAFRFRPAHSDALHVDLWLDGVNIVRDAGSFSYNVDIATLNQFAGVAGHNTISFDGADQMPRLGRFLFGEWLEAEDVRYDDLKKVAGASYYDWRGNHHRRQLRLAQSVLTVDDEIDGPFRSAVLRWRLSDGDWRVTSNTVTNGNCKLIITSSAPIKRLEIVMRAESLHYLEQRPIPVVECEFTSNGRITSEFSWT